MTDIKENTHIVIKIDDAKKYLSESQKNELDNILLSINVGRISDNKSVNTYLIVNKDEPYAKIIQDIIINSEHDSELLDKVAEKLKAEMIEKKYNIGNGHEISVEYDEKGIAKITRECLESLIEKQMPKKPICKDIPRTRGFGSNRSYYCPTCNEIPMSDCGDEYCDYYLEICPNCGQKLDWRE